MCRSLRPNSVDVLHEDSSTLLAHQESNSGYASPAPISRGIARQSRCLTNQEGLWDIYRHEEIRTYHNVGGA